MNNELMFFEGVEIEVLIKEDVKFDFNGEVLFNGRQVCEILEYTNPSKAISDHVRANQRVKVKNSDIVRLNFRKLNNAGETFITSEGILNLIQKANTVLVDFKEKFKGFLIKNNLIEDKIIMETREEIEFIKELNCALKLLGVKGIRQYKVLNYRIDYYIPKLNIAIEYDESNHKYYTYEQQEGRQKEIEQELGCKFIRVSDEDNLFYNIGLVIKTIYEMDHNKCDDCGCNMSLYGGEYTCGNCGYVKIYNPTTMFL